MAILRLVPAVVILLLAAGCAPPMVRGTFLDSAPTKTDLLTPFNTPLTREIGETMYERGVRVTNVAKTATILTPVTSSLDLGHKLDLSSGASGRLLTRSSGEEPALCFFTEGAGTVITTIGSLGLGRTVACLVDVDKDGSFDYSMFSTREKYFDISNKVPYETKVLKEEENELRGAFRVDFLYQGLSKGTLRFSYREFKDGYARPAFAQDLSYDIESDGTAAIGFKGMRIKVLKATNQSITYVVEKPIIF